MRCVEKEEGGVMGTCVSALAFLCPPAFALVASVLVTCPCQMLIVCFDGCRRGFVCGWGIAVLLAYPPESLP